MQVASMKFTSTADTLVFAAVTGFAALVGAFVGGPLSSRELDDGSYGFTFPQSASRARHLTAKFVPVAGLVALAKAKPGSINYSSSGAGTLTHLGAELFKYLTATNLVHVPYKGGGPALAAVIAGECDVTFQTPLAAAGQIKAGRLHALAVTSNRRLAMLPDVPTTAEAGVPKYEFQSWVGILAPAATPPAIVRQLNEHIVRAARTADVTERFAREGAEVVAGTPEQFRKVIAGETALWAKVIREMGIRAE
jgi:tripartite-type tricarboxylate transporter receptor subunit TctC